MRRPGFIPRDGAFWISGHTWATSDWRNGLASVPGKWFHADPKFFVNGRRLPPQWKKPRNSGVLVDETTISGSLPWFR